MGYLMHAFLSKKRSCFKIIFRNAMTFFTVFAFFHMCQKTFPDDGLLSQISLEAMSNVSFC